MPLSEYEYRVLAQIETDLCAQDPRLVARFRHTVPRMGRIGLVAGAVLCILGWAMMLSGVAFEATMVGGFPLLAVAGYVVSWVGAVHVVTPPVLDRTKSLISRFVRWAGRPTPGG